MPAVQRDYYQVLGVPRNAPAKDIRAAYRRLARKSHPDANPKDPQAAERFKGISEAYAVLSDPQKRAQYDQFGQLGDFDFRHGTGPGGLRWEVISGDPFDAEGPLGGMGSLFDQFFGGATRAQPQRGRDVMLELPLALDEAFAGGRRTVNAPGGRIEVVIPRGVDNGTRIRVAGQGEQPGGDLYLRVRLEPHPFFERRGRDIHCRVPVTFAEAALGATITVPTLHGPVELTIPPGTSTTQRLRLGGLGMPGMADARFGDQIVQIDIVVPAKLTEDEKRLVEQLAAARNGDPRAHLKRFLGAKAK